MGMAGMAAKGEFWYRHFFMALKAAREGCGIALIPRVLLAGS
jgi:hypothetical protein